MATLKTLVPILKILSNIPSIMKMFYYYYYFEQDCLSTQNFRNDFFFQILLLFLCKTFGHSIRIIWKHFNRFAMQIGSPAFVRIGHCDLFIYLFIVLFIYLFTIIFVFWLLLFYLLSFLIILLLLYQLTLLLLCFIVGFHYFVVGVGAVVLLLNVATLLFICSYYIITNVIIKLVTSLRYQFELLLSRSL